MQLTYRLKFGFARRHYHPIFVVVCRIISIIFSLFKVWMEAQTQKYIERQGTHCVIDQKQFKSQKVSLKEIRKLKKFILLSNVQKDNLHHLLQLELRDK